MYWMWTKREVYGRSMQLLRSNRLTTTISGKNKPLPKILLVLLETVCGLQGHNTPAIFAEENSGHPKLLVAIWMSVGGIEQNSSSPQMPMLKFLYIMLKWQVFHRNPWSICGLSPSKLAMIQKQQLQHLVTAFKVIVERKVVVPARMKGWRPIICWQS